jgi:hypothetical protein
VAVSVISAYLFVAVVSVGAAGVQRTENDTFVRISHVEISGKTGRPSSTVDVLPDGTVIFRGADQSVVRKDRLLAPRLEAIHAILERGIMNQEITDCGPVRATDSDSRQVIIETAHKTVIFKLSSDCRVPSIIEALDKEIPLFAARQ